MLMSWPFWLVAAAALALAVLGAVEVVHKWQRSPWLPKTRWWHLRRSSPGLMSLLLLTAGNLAVAIATIAIGLDDAADDADVDGRIGEASSKAEGAVRRAEVAESRVAALERENKEIGHVRARRDLLTAQKRVVMRLGLFGAPKQSIELVIVEGRRDSEDFGSTMRDFLDALGLLSRIVVDPTNTGTQFGVQVEHFGPEGEPNRTAKMLYDALQEAGVPELTLVAVPVPSLKEGELSPLARLRIGGWR